MRPCARGRQRLGLWLGSGLREALSGYLLIEPVTFLLRTSTSPAQRLGTTRRLHSGLATCERGVRMARPFAGGGSGWGKAKTGWRPDGAQRASQEACNQKCNSVAVEGGAVDEP